MRGRRSYGRFAGKCQQITNPALSSIHPTNFVRTKFCEVADRSARPHGRLVPPADLPGAALPFVDCWIVGSGFEGAGQTKGLSYSPPSIRAEILFDSIQYQLEIRYCIESSLILKAQAPAAAPKPRLPSLPSPSGGSQCNPLKTKKQLHNETRRDARRTPAI